MRTFCLLTFIAGSSLTYASAATISTVSINAGTTQNNCSQQSLGAQINCSASLSGTVLAQSSGSSSASFGLGGGQVQASASEGTGPFGSASAFSTAAFDNLLLVASLAGNTLYGNYRIEVSTVNDFGGVGAAMAILRQGSATQQFQDNGHQQQQPLLVLLPSSVQAGVPFEQKVNVSSLASSPGSETTFASVTFLGFTDASGKAVAFTVVPEPGTALLLAPLLLAFALRKRACCKP